MQLRKCSLIRLSGQHINGEPGPVRNDDRAPGLLLFHHRSVTVFWEQNKGTQGCVQKNANEKKGHRVVAENK